jgi:F-type H+-transporting ATPase subunit epsilon
MNTFRFVISSPDGNIFDGEIVMVSVRGIDGELAVMAGHIPFVTTVVACDCKIELPDDTDIVGHTEGGLLTVSSDKVTLLSGSFKFNN